MTGARVLRFRRRKRAGGMTGASTARSRRHRQRERDGMVHVTAWKNEAAIDKLLANHGLLPAYGADNREQRDAAWSELIDRLLAADAAQHSG